MIDIYNHHHVGKRYIKKNYKSALRKLEEEGKITCCKPASQRPMRKGERTFADKVMVTFSPKPSN